MAILRHKIIGSSSKSAIDKLIIVGIGSDETHTEMRIHKLHILLIEDKQDDIFGNSRCNLLAKNFLILIQYLV